MVITERELKNLEKIPGFENLKRYNETLIEINIKLEEMYIIINDLSKSCSMKNVINRYKTRIRELERKRKRLKNEYYLKLEKYRIKYGIDDTYKQLKDILENGFYIAYENKYAMMDDYLVNYDELQKKNKKLIKKKLNNAKKEI